MLTKFRPYMWSTLIIISLVLILAAVSGAPIKSVSKSKQVLKSTGLTALSPVQKYFRNTLGRPWAIAANADFTVSSGPGSKISFLEGQIKPLKVIPGDTQTMRLVIQGLNGISAVTAEIETDHGTTTVPLHKTGVVSAQDLEPRFFAYRVDPDGHFRVLTPSEALAYRDQAIAAETSSSLVNTALAAGGQKEVWEGSWVVHDTSVKTYHTDFLAKDTAGNRAVLTLPWSDPCNWPTTSAGSTYNIAASCPTDIASPAGVDNVNLSVSNNVTFTLANGGTLLVNSGKNIYIPASTGSGSNAGSITILTGGSIQFSNIYYTDADQDGYAASTGGGLPFIQANSSPGDANGFLQINGVWSRRGKNVLDSSGHVASSTVSGSSVTSQALAPAPKIIADIPADNRPKLLKVIAPAANALMMCGDCVSCWMVPGGCTNGAYYPAITNPSGSSFTPVSSSGYSSVSSGSTAFTSKLVRYIGFNFSTSTTSLPPYARVDGISVTINGSKNKSTTGAMIYAHLVYYDPTVVKGGGWVESADPTSAIQASIDSWPIPSSGSANTTIGNTGSYTWYTYFPTNNGQGAIYGSNFGVDIQIMLPAGNQSYTQFNINSVTINVGYTIVGLSHDAQGVPILDCADGDPQAHPGQSGFFFGPIKGSYTNITGGTTPTSSYDGKYYDYNCDGTNSKGISPTAANTSGYCLALGPSSRFFSLLNFFIKPALARPWTGGSTSGTPGWLNTVPDCGGSATYFYYCSGTTAAEDTQNMPCQ